MRALHLKASAQRFFPLFMKFGGPHIGGGGPDPQNPLDPALVSIVPPRPHHSPCICPGYSSIDLYRHAPSDLNSKNRAAQCIMDWVGNSRRQSTEVNTGRQLSPVTSHRTGGTARAGALSASLARPRRPQSRRHLNLNLQRKSRLATSRPERD